MRLATLEEIGPRVCLTPDCGTILSRHNSAQRCAACSNRVEIGGAVIRRDPPVIVARRPPPPEREPEPEPEPTRGKPCRIVGCNEQAMHNVGSRGVYGSLCDTHYHQRCEEASARAQTRAKPTRAPKKNDPPEPARIEGTRAESLARLTELGSELDAIDAQRWTLNDQASRILEEWGDLLRALARYDGDTR